MGTNTPNLNLFKPASSDRVDVAADLATNLDLIDAAVAGKAATGHTHSGTNVAFTPAGTISATNVQAAIEEVATDAAAALAAAVAAIPDPVAMALVFGGGIL